MSQNVYCTTYSNRGGILSYISFNIPTLDIACHSVVKMYAGVTLSFLLRILSIYHRPYTMYFFLFDIRHSKL